MKRQEIISMKVAAEAIIALCDKQLKDLKPVRKATVKKEQVRLMAQKQKLTA